MSIALAGLELHYVVRELQELVDGRIDKIYQDEHIFSIKLRKTGIGAVFLHYHMPSLVYTSQEKTMQVRDLPHFAAYLRKYISNARIKEIRQFSKRERLLEIVLEKEKTYRLIIELLPPGNLILCDENMLILSPFKPKKYSNRTIRAQAQYEMEIRQDLDEAAFMNTLSKSTKSLVKTLAIDMGLSGTYAEELCMRQKLDKSQDAKNISTLQQKEIYKGYLALFELPIKPCMDGKKIYPFLLVSKEVKALDGTFNGLLSKQIVTEIEDKPDPRIVKKKVIIEQQEKMLEQLQVAIDENQRKGELIYEHYTEIANYLENKENPPDFVKGVKDRKANLEFD